MSRSSAKTRTPTPSTVDGGNNNSQVWSNFTTVSDGASSSKPITNLYDGDINTFCFGSKTEGTITLSGVSIPYTQSIRIHSGSNGLSASVNGNASVDVSGSGTWQTVVEGPGTLSNLTLTAPAGFTAAVSVIEIDGLPLVDAVNNSQVWSQQASAEPVKKSNALAFDGDRTTSNQVAHSDADSHCLYLNAMLVNQ